MNKRISNKRKIIIAAISIMMSLLIISAVSMAAFIRSDDNLEGEFEYGTFSVEVIYAFSNKIEEAVILGDDDILSADIISNGEEDQWLYTNLHVWVKIKGYGEAYLRVGFSVSWYSVYSVGGVDYEVIYRMPYENLNYVNSLWLDDRKGDDTAVGSGYLYFSYLTDTSCSAINISELDLDNLSDEMTYTDGTPPELTIKVFNGIIPLDNYIYQGMSLKIITSVSAVQTNRYKQFWGIEDLPVRESDEE